MSIFNDFDETVIYDWDMFHGRIMDDFSMTAVNSTTVDNHKSTLCTGTNDLEDDTGAHTKLSSGQVEGAFGLFGNFIYTGNISGFNCDHKSCVEDKLLLTYDHTLLMMNYFLIVTLHTKEKVDDETYSNCDTKKKVDDETNSNCDTYLVEDESVRLDGKNSISYDVANHDHTWQPFCLENDFCDINSVQDFILEDMMSCSNSNKPLKFQKIWALLSDTLSNVVENMPTCIAYTPSWGYHFKKWKAKQHCVMHPCIDNNGRYYHTQHGLKKDFDPHVDVSATYL